MKQLLPLIIAALLISSSYAATSDEQVAAHIQEELMLTDHERTDVEKTLKEETNPYAKGRVFFCTEAGGALIVDAIVLTCRNFKGERHSVSFIGLGASLGFHGGLAIMYPKKKSRNFRAGTYNGTFRAIHFLGGITGIKITNENSSINYRIRGLSVGAGFNVADGLILIDK